MHCRKVIEKYDLLISGEYRQCKIMYRRPCICEPSQDNIVSLLGTYFELKI